MTESIQVKAVIPRTLKRRAFAEFAMQEVKFSHWLQRQLESWLEETEWSDERVDVIEDGC